jgi:hypothetical protein
MLKYFLDLFSMVVMGHCFSVHCLLPLTLCNNYPELLMTAMLIANIKLKLKHIIIEM